MADVIDIEGLPTLMVAARDEEPPETQMMVRAAQAASGGDPYIELWLSATKEPTVLDDQRTAKQVSRFILQQVSPKRGREKRGRD